MRASTFAAAVLSVLTLGCGSGSTSALLQIAKAPGMQISSLTATVTVDGDTTIDHRSLAAESGAVELPGSMLVLLPDESARVVVLLVAGTSDGGTVEKSVVFQSVPHQQVFQFVTLGSSSDPSAADSPDLAPPEVADLGAPANNPLPDLATAPQDANPPPPPDLAPVTLARDDFQRPNQSLWGKASDGQLWGFDANTSNTFSIVNKTGQIADVSGNNDTGTLGPVATNSETLITGTVNNFSKATEFGPIARFTDNDNFYKAIINGSILKIVRKVNGTSTDIVTANFAATGGTLYSIRFRVSGSTLSAKAWPAAGTEPTGFTVSVTDTTFTSGYCGVRLVFNGTNTATFTSFAAYPL